MAHYSTDQPIKSEIPLYKQSYGYSCGPASLVMVLGSLDPKVPLNLDLEVALWNDANLGESMATSAYGLALGALLKGYGARVYANGDGIGFIKGVMKHFPLLNVKAMTRHFEGHKAEARKLGIEEIVIKIELTHIRAELERGIYPIVLISSKLMGDLIGIPHWVVVTGIMDGKVILNNPETGRTEAHSTKRFLKDLGWGEQTRMVCVGG